MTPMELTPEELDRLCERYDQTDPKRQREIVGAMTLRAFLAERQLAIAEAALQKYAADPDCCYWAVEALADMENVQHGS